MKAQDAFNTSNPELTLAFYDALLRRGPAGQVAFGLFRASKRSDRAKSYRRRDHRDNAYGAKNQSLQFLNAALGRFAERLSIGWGWGLDDAQDYHRHVLYCDLPNGQVSFHSATNCGGPAYVNGWDGEHKSQERVLAYCEYVYAVSERSDTELLMPFGAHVGRPTQELPEHYRLFLRGWDGLSSWPFVSESIWNQRAFLITPQLDGRETDSTAPGPSMIFPT